MKFIVIPNSSRLPGGSKSVVYLQTDNWDDWFKYATMYNVLYYDEDGKQHRIGDVKIGEFGMEADQRRPNIPAEFETLSDAFFSLGQDDSYYEKLNELGDEFRDEFLTCMQDVAKHTNLFERALKEDVTGVSLLRFVSDQAVRGQFRRMAEGGARLTSFSFSYTPPPWGRQNQPRPLNLKLCRRRRRQQTFMFLLAATVSAKPTP